VNRGYVRCPACREPMQVQLADVGVGRVWHGVHCGWGQDSFDSTEVRPDLDTLQAEIQIEQGSGDVSRSSCELCHTSQVTTVRHGLCVCDDCAEAVDCRDAQPVAAEHVSGTERGA
jgi:hypothetical protein